MLLLAVLLIGVQISALQLFRISDTEPCAREVAIARMHESRVQLLARAGGGLEVRVELPAN